MKNRARNLSIILLVGMSIASCIKDRIQPAYVVPPTPTNDTLMYYWDFNNADSSKHSATFGITNQAYFSYFASYVDYTNGSPINLKGTSDSGSCLRVRNPSDSVIFYMPTTGYDSIVFSYVERPSSTTSGSTINSVSYTTDGRSFINPVSYTLTDTNFVQKTFSFSSDPNVKHNAKFAVKIQFVNNNTGTKGNDRFDNVSLLGIRK